MDIRKTYVIGAPVDDVWAALTDPEVIVRWGGGPVVMSAEPGFAFSMRSALSVAMRIASGLVVHIWGGVRLPLTSANHSGWALKVSLLRRLKASNQLCPNTADFKLTE